MTSSPDLRLLSLDGGGVRGLSELYILRNLLQKIAGPGQPLPKPCDYFDMIGGTSTGGIIAIMLGRLGMSIDECINAYLQLSREVFGKKKSRIPINHKLMLSTKFDSQRLEAIIRAFRGAEELFANEDAAAAKCKVFVCAVRKSNSNPALLRSWNTLDANDLLQYTTVWQACRATSAAPTFFDPIAIGPAKQELIDGGMGLNNPVEAVYQEAREVWGPDEATFKRRLICLVSIGTGVPKPKTLESGVSQTLKILSKIVTDTQSTADKFRRDKAELCRNGQYYRFNVDNGLQGIGLEEFEKQNTIADATSSYMDRPEIKEQLLACADSLRIRRTGQGGPTSFNASRIQDLASTVPSPRPTTSTWATVERATSSSDQYRVKFSLSGVPFAGKFVDRPKEMKAIKSRLLPPRRNSLVAQRNIYVLHGMGGIGKTQLAAKFFTDTGKEFTAAFWLRANTEHDLRQSLVKSARQIPPGQIPESGRAEFAAISKPETIIIEDFLNWLGDEGNTDWLLVFDNMDLDPAVESDRAAGAFNILDYLPAGHGAALITTRLSRLAQLGGDDDGEASLRLADQRMSAAIFRKWYGQANLENLGADYEQSLHDLVGQDMLDGLPLAIAQAAVYIRRTGIGIPQYKRRYAEMWPVVMAAAGHTRPVQGYHASVGTTWALSLKQVESRSPYAGRLVRMWAFLNNRDFSYGYLKLKHGLPLYGYYDHDMPEGLTMPHFTQRYRERDLAVWLVALSKNETQYLESIDSLLDFALIEPTQLSTYGSDQDDWADAQSYSMHPVVHAWSMQMQSNAEKIASLRDALRLFVLDEDIWRWSWAKQQRWLQHADRLCEWILAEAPSRDPSIAAEAIRTASSMTAVADLADLYTSAGQLPRTVKLLEVLQLLSCERQTPAVGSPVPNSLRWRIAYGHGLSLVNLERYAESTVKLQEALQISSHDFGSLRQDVKTRLLMSRAELALGRTHEAERLLAQVFENLESIPEEKRTRLVQNDVAWYSLRYGQLHLGTDRLEDAERLLKKAKHMAVDQGDTALGELALFYLVIVCGKKGDMERVVNFMRETLELKLGGLKLDHHQLTDMTVVHTAAMLAQSTAKRGNGEDAQRMLDLAYDSAQSGDAEAKINAIRHLGRRIWFTAANREICMPHLAAGIGRLWDESRRITGAEDHQGLDDPWLRAVLIIYKQLLKVYQEAGRKDEAAELTKQLAVINLRPRDFRRQGRG